MAWAPLGWHPAWFCEIDPFPSSVLAHRFPSVPNYGDFTQLLEPGHAARNPRLDLLVGGTPCQDFSVAGLRAGLQGARGSLSLAFCCLVGELRPKWVVWENVPGVLSIDEGRAFGALLGSLAELGYGFAWRVLDAQYFGLAQRRKRVFVVACAGGAVYRASSVLLEPESQGRLSVPSRQAGPQDPSSDAASPDGVDVFTGDKLRADPVSANEGRTYAHEGNNCRLHNCVRQPGMSLRRLTPLECERVQGFPDGWTDIPGATDTARYRAIGNSMPVPVMRWIGQRIQWMTP